MLINFPQACRYTAILRRSLSLGDIPWNRRIASKISTEKVSRISSFSGLPCICMPAESLTGMQIHGNPEKELISGRHTVEPAHSVKNINGKSIQDLVMTGMTFIPLCHIPGCRKNIILKIMLKLYLPGLLCV